MEIIFAVGHENQIAILEHPECTPWNEPEINFLYDEIEKGCPTIQEKDLNQGVYRGDFSVLGGLIAIWIIKRRWEREFVCN